MLQRNTPDWWDDVATVKVLHKRIRSGVSTIPDEFKENEMPDDLAEAIESGDVTSAAFEEGDEMPVPIAADCWEAFSDRLAAYDEDGDRLDRPSQIEEENFDTSVFRYQ